MIDPAKINSAVLAELRAEAGRLGYSRLGVAAAGPPPHRARFHDWLAAGHAGAMTEWLTRRAPLRDDPALLLAGVRSIVMLATDHATVVGAAGATHVAGGSDGSVDIDGAGTAAGSIVPRPARPGRGRVARYAWGDDSTTCSARG